MRPDQTFPRTCKALIILAARGFLFDPAGMLSRFLSFQALCSTWNLSAKLMSPRDLSERFDEHIADSLSLAPYLLSRPGNFRTLVDIGAGAGFPSMPLCLLLPELRAVIIERNETKATFLRNAVKNFAIANATILSKNYPHLELPQTTLTYTARAVETPSEIDQEILRRLKPEDIYLAQRDISHLAGIHARTVEKLDDEFRAAGLRRGTLHRIAG